MVDSNNASQFTSNYLSTMSPSEMVAAARRSSTPSPSISPTIDSFTHVIPELYDVPSDRSSNLPSNVRPRDLEASEGHIEPPKYRPILKWNALCVQALLYPIAVFLYLLIGAAIFTAIEYDHEKMAEHVAANQEVHNVDELQHAIESVLRKFNLSESVSAEILSNFTSLCAGYSNTPYQWEFLPAFYFSATVITTIGYGHMSPSTNLGRAFLCIYAVMGIPLLLVCLVTIGKYLSSMLDTIISRIPYKKSIVSKHKDVFSVGMLIVLAFIIVILIPATIFQKVETHWSYKDAVYFAIVSLTTIGFGDFTPAAKHLKELWYIVLYLTWLFIGLAIVSVLVTKLSKIYTRVNRSVIVLSKRCFKKCLKVKTSNHVLTYEKL